MVNLILKFAACSRAAGLRVSSSEVLDSLRHIESIDLLDEPLFKDVLRANFAKSRREQGKFDRLYHLFFHEMRGEESITRSDSLQEIVNEIVEALRQESADEPSSQPILNFLNGDPLTYLEKIRHIQTESVDVPRGANSNFAPLVSRLGVMSQINAITNGVENQISARQSTLPWETREALRAHFHDRLETVGRLLREDLEKILDEPQPVISREKHLNRLGETSFFSLTHKEVEEMREVVEQLVRKLKETVQRRYTRNSRGALDLKKTLRLSSKYQGIPIEIAFKHRPKRKGKIVTLCDVSGSVWSAAKFMLNMLYSLQDCFLQVRSFIFVSQLEEVTEVFEKYDINKAIDKALKEADLDYEASTDYGATFRQFKKNYMDILNKKTTLIIVGDGRTNYTNPEEEILRQMREKCRRIIWLNPETRVFWHTGDSRMKTYQAHSDEVRHCQNLNQLVDFIKTLIL